MLAETVLAGSCTSYLRNGPATEAIGWTSSRKVASASTCWVKAAAASLQAAAPRSRHLPAPLSGHSLVVSGSSPEVVGWSSEGKA